VWSPNQPTPRCPSCQANSGTLGQNICSVLQVQRRNRRFRGQARIAEKQHDAFSGTPGDLPPFSGPDYFMSRQARKGRLPWSGKAGALLVGIVLGSGKEKRLPHAESIS